MAKIRPDRIVIYIVDECINGNDATETRLYRHPRIGVPIHFDTFDDAQQYIDDNIEDDCTTYDNVTWCSHAVCGMLVKSALISVDSTRK